MSAALRWFRVAALAEACSWAALLVGMFFKYVVVHNEIGVQIFGSVHGAMFLAYVGTVFLAWHSERWTLGTAFLGLFSAVPPFMTVWFERRMVRQAAASSSAEPLEATVS
jgi:integral membrane protein